MIDHKIEEALNIPVLQISEDNLSDDEDYESYAGGPSARRMKSHQKKKRRSGSLSRVFTGTLGTIHLRRQHVLGGEGCLHVPMVQRSQYIRIKNPLHKHFAGMPMVGG